MKFRTTWNALAMPWLITVALLLPLMGQEMPQSIVLIIADGAGIGQHSLSYYFNDRYSPAKFEHVGLVTTHPINRNKVTDSAASGTAIATGFKTYNGAISVDTTHHPLKTVLEYAQEQGMATGLVATSTITNATPAAFVAHVDSRGNQPEIARQMVAAGVTILFGGGSMYFRSTEQGGKQDIDLLAKITSQGSQVIASLVDPVDLGRPLIGLFAEGSMPAAHEGREPSTAAMALKALELLGSDPEGFFLMVEESQVDWAGHQNDFNYMLAEMASLNDLIDGVLAYQVKHPEVLVILLADHETGGLAVQNKTIGDGLTDGWTSKGHTSNFIPVFATGPGAEAFDAVIDNTYIGQTLIGYVLSR